MDVRFINPFISSIKNVFSTMGNTEVTIGKPTLIKDERHERKDVSGVIGLSGDVMGAVILSFPTSVACAVASAFAGIELTIDHPDFADAIGELTNMVAGNAKKDFQGIHASISLPSVVIGNGHQVACAKGAPTLLIPCHTPHGEFDVEVTLIVEKAQEVCQTATVGASR